MNSAHDEGEKLFRSPGTSTCCFGVIFKASALCSSSHDLITKWLHLQGMHDLLMEMCNCLPALDVRMIRSIDSRTDGRMS